MFTGIIESLGTVKAITQEGTNFHIDIASNLAPELKIDQSIAHNGACLTVVAVDDAEYRVTAIQETMSKTNIGTWQEGTEVNLERCMQLNDRLDGHIVQGHVDAVAECTSVKEHDGSWEFHFRHPEGKAFTTVAKGSITVNGVSLTVVDSHPDRFSVAIIPYTYEHTNFRNIKTGDKVNLEFDIIGKYVARLLEQQGQL